MNAGVGCRLGAAFCILLHEPLPLPRGGQMNTTTTAYVPVVPVEHDAECRRGQDPTSQHYGLDRERCERCRNLWSRLDEAASRRES